MTSRTRAALLAATACVLLVTGCSTDEPRAEDPAASSSGTPDPAGTPTSTPTSAEATPTESAEPTETTETEPTDPGQPTPTAEDTSSGAAATGRRVTVPAYFAGRTPSGPRLFREFHRVPARGRLAAAAALLTTDAARDPHYRTLLPVGSAPASVRFEGGQFVVEVPDDTWTTRGDLTRRRARLAVQQLVHTLQGVQQRRAPVRAVLDGQPVRLLGVAPVEGATHAPPLEVLALVNVTTPEEGATVDGTFTATGVASSFEATVPWEIRKGGPRGRIVLEGFATAEGWIDRLYPWRTDVDVSALAPGEYTFLARTDDPSGGEGGGPTRDSKSITVR